MSKKQPPAPVIPIAPEKVSVTRQSDKKKVILTKNEYIASGGEGHVFAKDGVAYKVCHPNRMMPIGKIQELSVLDRDFVICPNDVLLDGRGRPIGYAMPEVKNSYSLSELFTTTFWDDHGLTPKQILEILRQFQEDLKFVHSKGILVVDLNEFNFRIDDSFRIVFFIDVNSYQTPNFPAAAIMPNIKDRHTKGFSELTDWYSWGVISFQLLIGIHPYKGRHPKYSELNDRMDRNVTVLEPEVIIPANCRDFSIIPSGLMDWYVKLLKEGKRLPPPEKFDIAVTLAPKIKVITGMVKFAVEQIAKYNTDVIRYIGKPSEVLTTKEWFIVNGKPTLKFRPKMGVGFGKTLSSPFGVYSEGGKTAVVDLKTGEKVNHVPVDCEQVMSCGGRVFIKSGNAILEPIVQEMTRGPKTNLIVTFRPTCSVMKKSTRLFDGIIVQNVLGSCFASIPNGGDSCYQVRLPEIEVGMNIVNAKAENGVCMFVVEKDGIYSRLIYKFAHDYSQFSVRVQEDIPVNTVNFTVLESGICVHIADDGFVEVFSNKFGSNTVDVVEDPKITSDMRLFNDGKSVCFTHGRGLYRLSVNNHGHKARGL